MLDLSKTNFAEAAENGFEFELIHEATGEGLGGYIRVRGDKSKKIQAFARKRLNDMQAREKKLKRQGKDVEFTIEDAEKMAIDSAVVRIIGWRGIGEAGQELPFTIENAERILAEHPWMREQIEEASSNLLNFPTE